MNQIRNLSHFKMIAFTSLVLALGCGFCSSAVPDEQYPQSRIVYHQTMKGELNKNKITCQYNPGSWGGNPPAHVTLIDTQSLKTPGGVPFPKAMIKLDLWQVKETECEDVYSYLNRSPELIPYAATFTITESVSMSLVNGQEVCSKYTDKSFELVLNDSGTNTVYSFSAHGPSEKKLVGTVIVNVAANDFCNLNLFR